VFITEVIFCDSSVNEWSLNSDDRYSEMRSKSRTASVICRSGFLPTDPEVPSSIPGAIRFNVKQWIWNSVYSASLG
jgi:hypothetical protein